MDAESTDLNLAQVFMLLAVAPAMALFIIFAATGQPFGLSVGASIAYAAFVTAGLYLRSDSPSSAPASPRFAEPASESGGDSPRLAPASPEMVDSPLPPASPETDSPTMERDLEEATCSSCGSATPVDAKYCSNCGQRQCPSCGGVATPEAKFCSNCGLNLTAGEPADPQATSD